MSKFIKDIFCLLNFHKDITAEFYRDPRDLSIVFKIYCSNCGKIFVQRNWGE